MSEIDDLSSDATAQDFAHAGLILLAFALFAVDQLVHYPVALMSLLGLGYMLAAPRRMADAGVRPMWLLFALIWLPMLLALSQAVDPEHSKSTVFKYLHFLPATYYVIIACRRPEVYRMVVGGVAILMLFAGFDAFAQLIWRVDLFGFPYNDKVLNGLFGEKQRLGLFLGVLSPLYFDAVKRWCAKYPPLWLVLIPLMIVIMMSLKRSGWIMLVVGVVAYFALRRTRSNEARSRLGMFKIGLIVAAVGLTGMFNPVLRNHLHNSAGLLSADAAQIDRASGYRVTLWTVGWRMVEKNWLLGVGPRGYRSAYTDYAAADDFWVLRGTGGQTHPHQMALEVLIETGVVGLACFALAYLILLRLVWRSRDGPSGPVCLLCAALAWLPLNTHMAFYGSYWATVAWLLIGIGLAGAHRQLAEPAAT